MRNHITNPLPWCLTFVLGISWLANAGQLDPPVGPVTSTGRFGPRTELNQATTPGDVDSLFKITQPGSYYLSNDITNGMGIEIATSNVTLNLNGFSVTSTAVGIFSTTGANITIKNGTVHGCSGSGISLGSAQRCRLQDLVLDSNGSGGTGATIGNFGVVRNCIAINNGAEGIFVGLASVVSQCVAVENAASGIRTQNGCTVVDSSTYNNASSGISIGSACTASNCVGHANLDGISTSGQSVIRGCTATGNTNFGLNAPSCLVQGNSVTGNGTDFIGAGARVVENFGITDM
jgi:hypothetical protein